MGPLLCVRDLCVGYPVGRDVSVAAINGVSFSIVEGETLGILGESGSGKSTLALTVLRLLPVSAQVSGSITFKEKDVFRCSAGVLRLLRGAQIALISQEPASALNPVIRAGRQVEDVLRAHRPWSRKRCAQEAIAILREVGLEDAERIYAAYPHQLSGGQRQRVAIAQALVCRPALLIADEPTTALDTTTQAEVLATLKNAVRRFGMAMLLISHDPLVIAEMAERVLVMRSGVVVEEGPVRKVFSSPEHAYTRSLLQTASQPLARPAEAAIV